MKKNRGFVDKRVLIILLTIISFISLVIFLLNSELVEIHDFCSESKDGYVMLSWKNSIFSYKKKIKIDIVSDDGTTDTHFLSNNNREFIFNNGKHGMMYSFFISYEGDDDLKETEAIFVNYNKMPSIPIININTDERVFPSFNIATTDERYALGSTIKDNEYVHGRISMLNDSNELYSGDMNIKIRGNTTAYLEKPGYKIKLSENVNLFDVNSSTGVCDEYVLLGRGTDINWLVGLYLSQYFDIEWQSKIKYINLFINGDYRGCYLLAESIGRSEYKINVDDTGFIIENNAYWWNADNEYFRINHQIQETAYTLVYPAKFNNENVTKIKNYVKLNS